jgi:ParB-like chromosome segregation protein Spo0J
MECHPVCDLFPEMAKQEFTDLCEDIAKHGQHTPIWTHAGQIVDGRHRYRACCLLGIAPKFQEWSGEGSLVSFVVSLNLHRRQLNLDASQRAALGVDIKAALVAEGRERQRAAAEATNRKRSGTLRANSPEAELPPPLTMLEQTVRRTDDDLARMWRSREEAAELVNVSARTITDAEKVKKADPEAFEAIKRGEKTVHAAKRELEQSQGRARPIHARVVELTRRQLDGPEPSPVGGFTKMYVPDDPEAFVQPLMTHYGKLWPRFLAAANAATKGARNAG